MSETLNERDAAATAEADTTAEGVHPAEDVEGATDIQEPVEEVQDDRPASDHSEDVGAGDSVTVTLPRAAAEVLANPEGRKLAEVGDAQNLLREQL